MFVLVIVVNVAENFGQTTGAERVSIGWRDATKAPGRWHYHAHNTMYPGLLF